MLARVGLFKARLRSCCESKVLPFIHVITGLLGITIDNIAIGYIICGITRYLACSMPNLTTQPVSMYRKPLHFQLVTNGRCVVSNETSSSKRAGSKGQQPVKWHCSSDRKAVTETEVATIVPSSRHLRTFPTQFTQHRTILYTDDLNNTLIPTRSHTSIHLQHYTSQRAFAYTLKHPTLSTSLLQ